MPHPRTIPTPVAIAIAHAEDSLETVWMLLGAKMKVTFSILHYHYGGRG